MPTSLEVTREARHHSWYAKQPLLDCMSERPILSAERPRQARQSSPMVVRIKYPVRLPWELSAIIKAKAGRFTAVFVSRLDADTTEADMERFVQETHQLASTCSKSKHDSYASFKVEVMCRSIAYFYRPDKWPAGTSMRFSMF